MPNHQEPSIILQKTNCPHFHHPSILPVHRFNAWSHRYHRYHLHRQISSKLHYLFVLANLCPIADLSTLNAGLQVAAAVEVLNRVELQLGIEVAHRQPLALEEPTARAQHAFFVFLDVQVGAAQGAIV